MAPTTENPQQGPEKQGGLIDQTDRQPVESPSEVIAVAIERRTHNTLAEQQKDNVEFLSALNEAKETDRQKSLEKAAEWQKAGDLDLLRAAGLSLDEVKKNPLERHVRLSSMFLHREKDAGGLTFKVDYSGMEMPAWDLDLADILPPNILTISILGDNGQVIHKNAIRGFADGRPGYFDPVNKDRIYAQGEQKIRIQETQSSMAMKDKVFGEQTQLHTEREQVYLLENAQKTVLKTKAREEAAKHGQELKTDKSFFDVFLSEITKAINGSGTVDPNNPLKIDFSKITESFNTLLATFGFAKLLPGSPGSSSSTSGTGRLTGTTTPSAYGKERLDQIKKSPENKNGSRINQKWLLENVGRSNAEVQRFMVKINFMGVNMRVNKLIAPYLIEAEQRARNAGINYQVKPGLTYCQNWREKRGGNGQSMHSWGTAIDINSTENPWQPGLNGKKDGHRMVANIPPDFVNIMKSVGFIWGGEWNGTADPMHFEMYANPYQNRSVLLSSQAQQAASQYLS